MYSVGIVIVIVVVVKGGKKYTPAKGSKLKKRKTLVIFFPAGFFLYSRNSKNVKDVEMLML